MTMTDFYTGSKAAVVAKAKAVLLLVQYTIHTSGSESGSGSKYIRVTCLFLFNYNCRAIRNP
jgi:hypothetical protein